MPPTGQVDSGTPVQGEDATTAVDPDSGVIVTPEEDGGTTTPGEDATTTPADDAGELPRYTWWGEVRAIVHEKCILCHASPPQFGAPRALFTYADTQEVTRLGVPVHEMMALRVNAPQNRMPPPTQPQLSDAEMEIIRVWSAIGAPEGTPPAPEEDAGTVETDSGVPADPDAGTTAPDATVPVDAGLPPSMGRTIDVLAHAPNAPSDPFDIPVANTQYLCWSVTVPATTFTEEHAVMIEPIIVNTTHLHHLLLFTNEQGNAQDGPFDCGSWDLQWNLVGGWAPGRGTELMPAGVGVRLEPGQQLVMQAHYDSVGAPGQQDMSGFRVHTTDATGLIDAGMLWSGVSWIQAINGPNVDKVGTCTINTPITIFSAFPHMHQLGTKITLEVQRAGDPNWTTLVDIDPWSFNDQPNILIDPAEQMIMPGDKLRTHCWWNTGGRNVPFGEASQDEMCFNFIYHYPLMSNQYQCWSISL